MGQIVKMRNHPLMPKDVNVAGYIMDSETGELRAISSDISVNLGPLHPSMR